MTLYQVELRIPTHAALQALRADLGQAFDLHLVVRRRSIRGAYLCDRRRRGLQAAACVQLADEDPEVSLRAASLLRRLGVLSEQEEQDVRGLLEQIKDYKTEIGKLRDELKDTPKVGEHYGELVTQIDELKKKVIDLEKERQEHVRRAKESTAADEPAGDEADDGSDDDPFE